jgi:hypothetical protein
MLKIMNGNDYLMTCNSQINIIVVASTFPRTVVISKTVALDTITHELVKWLKNPRNQPTSYT